MTAATYLQPPEPRRSTAGALRRPLFLLILTLVCTWCAVAQTTQQVTFPCYATATTTLNVRQSPWVSAMRVGQLRTGDRVVVTGMADKKWGRIQYGNTTAYIHMDYVRLSPIPAQPSSNTTKSSSNWFSGSSLIGLIFKIALSLFLIYVAIVILYVVVQILCKVGIGVIVLFIKVAEIVNIPFLLLNMLQRFLAKPWRIFIKYNRFSDSTNRTLRIVTTFLKIPFYLLLTPLRLLLACYFNLLIHCSYELINYLLEVVTPQKDGEGYSGWWEWTYMLPVRILKYLCWHGSLTLIESVIWTAIDTVLPALTLYHGTDVYAAENILSSPDRSDRSGNKVSLWIVGGGNYAGNGIYFAPVRSTSFHYADGVLILCRVTLGRTLDLGLAPRHVYNACGHPNATVATAWGLGHGFVTGEWWRSDQGWWEYCMYDWKNRYNYSWRIRPIFVMPEDGVWMKRIPGGMHHWLFREIVIKDLWKSITEFGDSWEW